MRATDKQERYLKILMNEAFGKLVTLGWTINDWARLTKSEASALIDDARRKLAVAEVETWLRELHVIQGVCHRHPHVRVSTGGDTPMFDAPCGACENEMGDFEETAK